MTEPEPTAEDVLARALEACADPQYQGPQARSWWKRQSERILAALTPADKRVLVAELLDEETLARAILQVWEDDGYAQDIEMARSEASVILRALASASPEAAVFRGDSDE